MRFKLPFFFALAFGISFFSQAQGSSASTQEFEAGVKAGWHYANMYRSGSSVTNNLNSFYVGLFSERSVNERLAVASGLEYFQNGFQSSDGSFRMHTLSLPTSLKIKLGPVYIGGGFGLNFKLGDNREDFPGGEVTDIRITDTYFFDIPLSAGFGLRLGRLQVDAKYNWGMFQAANINGYGYKNQYFQLGLGLFL